MDKKITKEKVYGHNFYHYLDMCDFEWWKKKVVMGSCESDGSLIIVTHVIKLWQMVWS